MSSYWHSTILGKYNPEDRWVGLDFRNLFLDPLATKLTHIHELTHSVLSRSTDFGQATEVIYQLLPKMKHLKPEDKDLIRQSLRNAQVFTQEGSACLMELLRLRGGIGRQAAIDWAKEHFTDEYYQIVEKFFFVLELGQRYRDCFTMQIPHSAMHTGIRKVIVQQDLLSSAEKFVNYLQDKDNNPDARIQKMIDIIRYQTYVPTRPPQEICSLTGIAYFNDVTKQDAADFLNYMHNLAGNKTNISADQIRDYRDIDVLSEANEQIIIGNMNLNLQDNATVLWKVEDLLHYKDIIEAVMVNRMGDDLEYKDSIEQLIGKRLEAALVAFLKTGEKYMFGSDIPTITKLLVNEFTGCTLIVKWGLYKPNEKELLYFPNSRRPDVVIYNTAKDLDNNFNNWLQGNNQVGYLFLKASEDHPFQIILIKDNNNVLHFLNTFNKPANDFLKKYSKNLVKSKPEEFLAFTKHYNNALSVWGGMPFEVDWYKSMLDGKNIHLR